MAPLVVLALLLTIHASGQEDARKPLVRAERRGERILTANGIEAPELSRLALGAFFEAWDAYRRGEFEACGDLCAAIWERAPRGTAPWAALPAQPSGANFGTPTCYYALRMLERCADWRRSESAIPPAERRVSTPVVLSVLLVGHAEGLAPRNTRELAEGSGERTTNELAPALLADDSRVIRDSLALFQEYVIAATDGRLSVDVRFVPLTRLVLPVQARAEPLRTAGLAPGAMESIWSALDEATRISTDWWWVLYPSHVPERFPDFATTEFITGGMDVGPNGGPCFVIDDRWLVRKPPHLGRGPYSAEEREAYLPQWLQHEFFHHLFREYPEFLLEAEGHQWFDRTKWPPDFEGRFEPDYYEEALDKRLRSPGAQPPLHVKLRYAAPPVERLRKVSVAMLEGAYERRPVENDWHRVTLKRSGTNGLQWKNAAGAQWRLELDRKRGTLTAGPDCPYYDRNAPRRNDVAIVLSQGEDGEFIAEVDGLRWGGEIWRRITK